MRKKALEEKLLRDRKLTLESMMTSHQTQLKPLDEYLTKNQKDMDAQLKIIADLNTKIQLETKKL